MVIDNVPFRLKENTLRCNKIMQECKLSAVCEKVFDRCLAPSAGGEGCDNMTMILVQFKKPSESGTSTEDQPLPSDQQPKTDGIPAEPISK